MGGTDTNTLYFQVKYYFKCARIKVRISFTVFQCSFGGGHTWCTVKPSFACCFIYIYSIPVLVLYYEKLQ